MSAWDDPVAHIWALEAKLAAVKALADEWAGDPVGDDLWRFEAVEDLRAALDDR